MDAVPTLAAICRSDIAELSVGVSPEFSAAAICGSDVAESSAGNRQSFQQLFAVRMLLNFQPENRASCPQALLPASYFVSSFFWVLRENPKNLAPRTTKQSRATAKNVTILDRPPDC
ncbi:MAG: hypothetical protein HC942_06075 [Microcoleus sp. SU_5_6]|nr:hypothetical protein [Microcoleus sp. SU_5_6]